MTDPVLPETAPSSALPRVDVTRARTIRRDSILVFVLALSVAFASLPHRSGFPIGDAVEYLRNAGRVEEGLALEVSPGSVRPFFFSALLLPVFRAARVFGSADGREVIAFVTALMLVLAGITAVATYRFVERLTGAPAALGAALFLTANRVFGFWAPTVMTDVPAALCIVAAASVGLARPTALRALGIGALLGCAILLKYQSILVGGLVIAGLPILWWRDGRRIALRSIGIVVGGVLLALLAQSFLDMLAGRSFGSTLHAYVKANVMYQVVGHTHPFLRKVFGEEAFSLWAQSYFGVADDPAAHALARSMHPEMLLRSPMDFYWTQLPEFLTWMEFCLLMVGVGVLAWRRPRAWWLPLVVVGGTAFALTAKGHKEFRLWVPAAPFVFALVGIGFASVIAWLDGKLHRLAAPLAFLLLAPNLLAILGGVPLQTRLARVPWMRPLLAYDARTPLPRTGPDGRVTVEPRGWRPWQVIPEPKNPAEYGGYARAAQWLNRNAPAGSRVSGAWFWQFTFRLRPDLILVEPRYQVDTYASLGPPERGEVLASLRSCDYFVAHLSALVLSPEVFEVLDTEFEVLRSFENAIYDEGLDTIFVLERRARPSLENAWVRIHEGPDAERVRLRSSPDRYVRFVERAGGADRPIVELLDCRFDRRELAEGHVVLLTTWRVPEGSVARGHSLFLQLRITNARGEQIGSDASSYRLAFGRLWGERWKPGVVVEQRVPIRPARELFDFARPRDPAEAVSLDAWIQLVGSEPASPPERPSSRTYFPEPDIAPGSRIVDPDFGRLKVGGTDVAR